MEIKELVSPYDTSISTTRHNMVTQLIEDMTLIGVLAGIIIVIVLLLTSKSYAEVPILLITFGVAALLNMGTNFCWAGSPLYQFRSRGSSTGPGYRLCHYPLP